MSEPRKPWNYWAIRDSQEKADTIRQYDRELQFRNPEREYIFSAEDQAYLKEMGIIL